MGVAVEIHDLLWWMCEEPSLLYFKRLLGGTWGRVRHLVRWIKENQVDLVYTSTSVIFEGALAARLAGIPHVWHVHEVLKPKHMRFNLLPVPLIIQLIGKFSDRVIFESEAARTVCRAAIPHEKSLTVYNSLRFPVTAPVEDKSVARAQFGLDAGRCLILWMGRFSTRKNPLLLIRTIPLLQHKNETLFVFVGQGPLEGDMTSMISLLHLEGHCRLLPFQVDAQSLLRAADALVLTSDEESFGLVLVEAGACELPVVATRTQGPAEIVDDGQTGFLIGPGNEAELATCLDRLIHDRDLRQDMGRKAAAHVADLFSAAKNTARIQAVFDELLGVEASRGGVGCPKGH
jgi:glycosyltransferase involved in cell wall biosynthesis